MCAGESSLEVDIFVQVMAFGNMLQIAEDLRLVDVVRVPGIRAEVLRVPRIAVKVRFRASLS